jgi:hypothetical protein
LVAKKPQGRESELATELAKAVEGLENSDVVTTLAELREHGILHRPTYRLTSPHGSGGDMHSKVGDEIELFHD